MRTKKTYPATPRQRFRPEISTCPTCGTWLRRYGTLSERTIITLQGPLPVTHCGYRCPNRDCTTAARSYRSAAADALALPGFTFGLDIIVWVGHLRLAQQHTLDQTHQALLQHLALFALTISRREVLYLFEAYCTLLRASQEVADDRSWQAQARSNGGLILSLDGIQPDKGNETVYLVRDLLTGRLLVAENVRSSRSAVIQQLLAPVVALDVPIVAVVSDAQESLVQAVAALWPEVPHQVCQFHYLREASRPMYELDRSVRTQMRQAIQQPVREVRHQITRLLDERVAPSETTPSETTPSETTPSEIKPGAAKPGEAKPSQAQGRERTGAVSPAEKVQLAVLDDYALGIQTALNVDGQQPFRYASLAADEALSAVATSLETLVKRGPAAHASRPNCSVYRTWWPAGNSGRKL